jgi:hypothetical protein
VLAENRARGLRYITDADARPVGAATPTGALWDNGADAVQALELEMAVRRDALDRFSEAVIRDGRPLATLEEALVPLYLRHRYQVDATAHLVGGVAYGYTSRGEGAEPPMPVDGDTQRAAIDALLMTVTPEALALPEAARRIPPRPPGYSDGRELFDGRTGLTFDPVAPAETAARLTFGYLFDADRAARLTYQHDLDPSLPSYKDLLDRTGAMVWMADVPDAHHEEIRRTALSAWVDVLMELAADADAAPTVRAMTELMLEELATSNGPGGISEDAAFIRWVGRRIEAFLDRDYDEDAEPQPVTIPPGSPIGQW